MQLLASICCIVVVINTLYPVVYTWKPIASSSYSTAYTLQQSHPELDSKSFYKKLHDTADYPSTYVQETIIGGSEKDDLPIPASIHFDDEQFGYIDKEYQDNTEEIYGKNQCAVKKYAFNFDGIAKYKSRMPELNQFTICFWMRFTNHSGDHVILTYSVHHEPREVQFWVANSKNSSFLSMAIKGQQIYRLNYPMRIRKWHHACSSWNGKTGEWQVWFKAERIGRGFHNALVGHKIPANGELYSGGSSVTGDISSGLHFEITFVQIYKVALSAGKAHRDHKHHHVHHFDHEGQELPSTTKPPPKINRPQPMHSLLASGQIPSRLALNLAKPQGDIFNDALPFIIEKPLGLNSKPQSVIINTNFVNGQLNSGSRMIAQQLVGIAANSKIPQQSLRIPATLKLHAAADDLSDTQYVDETEAHIIFKRESDTKPETQEKHNETTSETSKGVKKRGLVFLEGGPLADDALLKVGGKFIGLADYGGLHFRHSLIEKMSIEDEISSHDKEPAEEEVKAVMSLCSLCDLEPFQGAVVFTWVDVEEELDNAIKGYSVGKCGNF